MSKIETQLYTTNVLGNVGGCVDVTSGCFIIVLTCLENELGCLYCLEHALCEVLPG